MAAGAVAPAVSGAGNAVADNDCPSVEVIAIPGTLETGPHRLDGVRGHGMLSGVTNGLGDSHQVDYIDYPATAVWWDGEVYGTSKHKAVDNARGLIAEMAARCATTQFAVVGYSQGADAAGDLAAEIGTGHGVIPPERFAGAGLISDPSRSPADIQVGPPAPGAGAEGSRPGGFGFVNDRVRTVCIADDLYCATDEQDYVSRLAGLIVRGTEMNPAGLWRDMLDTGVWIGDLGAHGGIPTLASQMSRQSYEDLIDKVQSFLQSGAHVAYPRYQVGDGQNAIGWMHDYVAGMG
ncbi:cutinase family protein [Nocardia stercoris]|uniref:Cutinase family protein n=2 Tax=Nocardia stercoris TaxID=2483361 RepID=A0A3M2LA07_9NOCA|nr:cutinase family protein [Nocardia stercoris]